jgi:hypothetical protein
VDRQVVAIKQHLLPDPLKPKPARELLDPRALIEQSVEIVSTLSGSQFEKYFYDIKQVRARTPAVRAAICHAMLTLLRESNAQKYLLSTKVEDKTLFVLLLGLNGLRGQQPADFDHYAQLKSDEDLLMHGYSYCRDLVQLVGGKVSAGIEKRGRGWRSFVQMTFPVEAAKVRTFGEGAG